MSGEHQVFALCNMNLCGVVFLLFLSLFSSLWTLSATEQIKYAGYAIHRFIPQTEEDRQILIDMEKFNPGVLFMKRMGKLGTHCDIMFPPHLQQDTLNSLVSKIPGLTIHEDLDQVIAKEARELNAVSIEDAGNPPPNTYWTLDVWTRYMKQKIAEFPELCTEVIYGKSYEKRELLGVIVNKKTSSTHEKPVVLIDGGFHAREWITYMTCTRTFTEFITSESPEIQLLLETFTFIFCCMVNPDGFKYSMEKDRMWRKTRQLTNNKACVGIDPNRNWDFAHGGPGSSANPCDETYHGPTPFCTPETNSLRKLAMQFPNLCGYFSMHSYSQLILLSYGCHTPKTNVSYPQFDQHLKVANLAIEEMKNVGGAEYKAGNSEEILYAACGTSADWMKREFDIAFAYTFELRDTGKKGFILGSDQIDGTCTETIAALKSMLKSIRSILVTKDADDLNNST